MLLIFQEENAREREQDLIRMEAAAKEASEREAHKKEEKQKLMDELKVRDVTAEHRMSTKFNLFGIHLI